MTVQVKFKKLHTDTILPKKAHDSDAGFDLYAYEDVPLAPLSLRSTHHLPWERCVTLVSCGFSMELPERYEAQIRPRSGLACKKGITVINSPGTVDCSYRGDIKVGLVNLGSSFFTIKKGDRIAQMVIQKLPDVEVVEVDELSESDRNMDGFGSTGK